MFRLSGLDSLRRAGSQRGCLAARALREPAPGLADFAMDFRSARRAVLQLLGTTAPADVPALLHWMRTTRKQSWLEPGGWRLDVVFGYQGVAGLGTGSLGSS